MDLQIGPVEITSFVIGVTAVIASWLPEPTTPEEEKRQDKVKTQIAMGVGAVFVVLSLLLSEGYIIGEAASITIMIVRAVGYTVGIPGLYRTAKTFVRAAGNE